MELGCGPVNEQELLDTYLQPVWFCCRIVERHVSK